MIEVKFRGRRISNGEWLHGFVHVIDTLGNGYTGRAIQIQSGNSRPYSVQVDETTIGQYTGLKDKKGKLIFEGDILNCRTQIIKTMEWLESREIVEDIRQVYDLINYEELEVIGNIFDNPELLEEPL